MSLDVEAAGVLLTDPVAYTDERIHAALRVLRERAPVHLVRAPGFDPFWAITRYADVLAVEQNSAVFRNAPRIRLAPAAERSFSTSRKSEFARW